jgi:hypothetical protein
MRDRFFATARAQRSRASLARRDRAVLKPGHGITPRSVFSLFIEVTLPWSSGAVPGADITSVLTQQYRSTRLLQMDWSSPLVVVLQKTFSCREDFRRKDLRRRKNSAEPGIGSKPQDRVRKIS